MKYVAPVAAAALVATQSVAGDLSEPVVTEVEEPEAAASSSGWILPLLLLGGVLLLANDDNDTPATPQHAAITVPVPGPPPGPPA